MAEENEPVEFEQSAAEEKLAAIVPAVNRIMTVDAIVDAWFNANHGNSPLSRNTALYNHVFDSLADLKARLLKEV